MEQIRKDGNSCIKKMDDLNNEYVYHYMLENSYIENFKWLIRNNNNNTHLNIDFKQLMKNNHVDIIYYLLDNPMFNVDKEFITIYSSTKPYLYKLTKQLIKYYNINVESKLLIKNAINKNNYKLLKYLLKNNRYNIYYYKSLLLMALNKGRLLMVNLLLDYNKDKKLIIKWLIDENQRELLNIYNDNLEYAINIAIKRDNIYMCKFLIKKLKSNININNIRNHNIYKLCLKSTKINLIPCNHSSNHSINHSINLFVDSDLHLSNIR